MLGSYPKTICISGASSGIGLALARLLAKKACYQLALGARRYCQLEDIKVELLDLGAPAVFIKELDVQSDENCKEFANALGEFCKGELWALCNNAGLALSKTSVLDGNLAEWQTMLNTNVLGVLSMTRHLAPLLTRPGGLIVMTGSISGHQVYEGGGVYCASKFALKALTQALRLELNGSGIRVGSIDPGMIDTEFSLVRFQGDSKKAESVYKGMTPLSAQDVAECMAFMLTRPPHVCIDEMIVMPTDQASVSKVHRSN